ncbi:hypothetical protein ACV35V_34540, partial [Pseudomonas aeruginosa]
AVFVPRNGLAVIRSRRPLMQLARALCLIGTSLFFTTGLRYLPLAEADPLLQQRHGERGHQQRCQEVHRGRPGQ